MKKLLTLAVMACAVVLLSSAQVLGQKTVTGVVTDANGEALIGANVLEKGTSNGTISDIDGSYSLSVAEGATLVFSYTGFTTQEIQTGASNTVSVTLQEGELLNEVVVTGYGTQKSKEVTSSISSVKAEDFNQGAIQDPVSLIQGKVPGLNITNVGGSPNGSSEIRLRGVTSFGANASPLIVIDGVIGGTLDNVDPNDIESIDVLKDGSAAAIYGTRASSGVILVTTKRGNAGETKVEYNVYGTAEGIAQRVPTLTADEFVNFRPNVDRGAETDWVDEVTRTGLTHVHNLSLSGGSTSTTYRASLNYRDVQGVGLVDGFNQLNGRINLSQKALNDKLKVDLNLSATQRDANFGFNEAFRYATLYNPTAPVFFNEGDELFERFDGYYQEINFDYFNPVAIIDQNTNTGETNDLLLSGKATYEIVDGFKVAGFLSQQKESGLFGQFFDKNSFFRGEGRNGLASRQTFDTEQTLFELTATYDTEISSGVQLSALAGYSWQEITSQGFNATVGDFISDDISFNNLGFGLDVGNGIANVGSFKGQNRIIGFFGRANLNFNDDFFVSASVRRDGSSRFGDNNKWGVFGAVSAGANLVSLLGISGPDQLKLRVGYGVTGADAPGNLLSRFRFDNAGSFFFNGNFVSAVGPTQDPNPDLKWEVKQEINAGLDFAFGDYKWVGSIDVYNRTTSDLILPNLPVPQPPSQSGSITANLEDVELVNSGVEFSISYNHVGDGFSWTPTVNLATYRTRINQVEAPDAAFAFFQSGGQRFDTNTSPGAPGLNDDPSVVVQANSPLGQFWGFSFEGIGDDGEFIFEDVNGDGALDAADEQVIGQGLPDFSLGFQNQFNFGNVDFSFFLRGDFGHQLANMWRVFYEPLGNGSREIENIVFTEFFDDNLTATPIFSSYYVEDASFVALDNVTLGYNFDMSENSSFDNIRFYVNARNLFYITGYSGADPSVRYQDFGNTSNGAQINTTNGNPLAPGIDRRNNYFRTRSFTVGATFGF